MAKKKRARGSKPAASGRTARGPLLTGPTTSMAARNLVNMVAVVATSSVVLLCLLAAKRFL
jgi:hypothetical protein